MNNDLQPYGLALDNNLQAIKLIKFELPVDVVSFRNKTIIFGYCKILIYYYCNKTSPRAVGWVTRVHAFWFYLKMYFTHFFTRDWLASKIHRNRSKRYKHDGVLFWFYNTNKNRVFLKIPLSVWGIHRHAKPAKTVIIIEQWCDFFFLVFELCGIIYNESVGRDVLPAPIK